MTENSPEVSANTDSFRPILTQTQVEQQMLHNAQEGLLASLSWETTGETFSRKLSSIRFAARTYREHLDRVFAIEEHDGYMECAIEQCPQFADKVQRLRLEHADLRERLKALMVTLERLMPNDHLALEEWRTGILDFLQRYRKHNQQETRLIQDAFLIDYGCGD